MMKNKEMIVEKLNNEKRLRKKYNPILAIAIVLFAFLFSYIIYLENGTLSLSKIIGICCVTLAGIVIAFFSQAVKVPLGESEHDQSSMDFLKTVKVKLDKSRKSLTFGIILQILLLTTGLYLIIFYDQQNIHSGYLFSFFGIMLSLGGGAIGKSIATFNNHYSTNYQTINHFTKV